MTFEVNLDTVSILEISALNELNGEYKTISILSSCTMLQLHFLLIDAFGLNKAIEVEHFYKQSSINHNERLKNITFAPISSPNHFDGWLTTVAPGIYIEHSHPHEPLSENGEIEFAVTQIRAEQMWCTGLVFTKANHSLAYHHLSNGFESKIILTLSQTRQAKPEDAKLFYPINSATCSFCTISDCVSGDEHDSEKKGCGATSGENCCEACLFPCSQGWQGLGSDSAFEAKIYELLNQACVFVKQERDTFLQAQSLKLIQSNNTQGFKFNCQWIESTGESCAYCTEDFL